MEVSRIFINTYRRDFHFARACVSSIRYWYPEIPVWLIKDMGAGGFDTGSMESFFNVRVLDTGKKSFGWGFGKFEPLFGDSPEPFLFMDADTVMTGPILDRLSGIDADFIVDEEVQHHAKLVDLYFDPQAVAELDPSYEYPGYTFNTGQWAATPGLFKRHDFEPFLSWDPVPSLRHKAVFKQADQGLFNYLMHKKQSDGAIRLRREPIMIWPDSGAADHVDLDAIRRKSVSEDRIIHWAGMKNIPAGKFPRRDIVSFYLEAYYGRTGIGQRLKDFSMDSLDDLGDLAKRIWRRVSMQSRNHPKVSN